MTVETTSILIVDDSALYRQSITNVMRDFHDVSIVGVAKNGVEAIEKIRLLDPDLLTLDVQMPDMDGIGVLREIKAKGLRAKAIMVSSYTAEGAQVTTDALMEGAFDFILKPSSADSRQNRRDLRDALQSRIEAFRSSSIRSRKTENLGIEPGLGPGAHGHPLLNDVALSPIVGEIVPQPTSLCRAVIIGASTGGPAALKEVLPKFPANTPAPVIVVQHMPERFTASLARRLDELCPCRVVEATDGMLVEPGQILIARGGSHLELRQVEGRLVARLSDAPPVHGVRPSVDVLIESSVDTLGGNVLAIILTGMGRDGLQACRELKRAGGYVFVQRQDDCVVYGMPKAIADAGLADRTLSLGMVAPAALRHLKRSRRGA